MGVVRVVLGLPDFFLIGAGSPTNLHIMVRTNSALLMFLDLQKSVSLSATLSGKLIKIFICIYPIKVGEVLIIYVYMFNSKVYYMYI